MFTEGKSSVLHFSYHVHLLLWISVVVPGIEVPLEATIFFQPAGSPFSG